MILYKTIAEHAQKLPLEQAARPLRPAYQNDLEVLVELINAVRKAYAAACDNPESEAVFETIKRKLLNVEKQRRCWTDETRNLYSSVISSYIGRGRGKGEITTKERTQAALTKAICEMYWEEERKLHAV